MSSDEYAAWYAESLVDYAQSFVDSGILSPDQARRRAEDDFSRLLPDGVDTAEHVLRCAFVDDQRVGVVWVHVFDRDGAVEAFVYDVEVAPEHRGKGYGRALMQACHELCRERGAGAVSLNVFGHNEVARRLYDSLGYQVTSTSMKLAL